MSKRTAQLIGLQPWLCNFAHVYRLSHQVTVDEVTTDHVIVSVSFSPPEAIAFACDAEANLLPDRDSRTRAGYAPGSMSHEDAIAQGMGYELLPPAEPLREFPNDALPPPKTEEERRAFAEAWNVTLERSRVAIQRLGGKLRHGDDRSDGLDSAEGKVIDHLVAAVRAYGELTPGHPSEPHEFASAIHDLQQLLAARAMRRLYPEGWS